MSINEEMIKEVASKLELCRNEIAKGIIGQEEIVNTVLIAIFSGGNVLLEGMPLSLIHI